MAEETKKPAATSADPKTPAENPKITAPAGTVPTAAQTSGPTPPHPTSTEVDHSADTPEVEKALARVADERLGLATRTNAPTPYGDPIQCIAKRKFFDERGATIRVGQSYYYQPKKDVNGEVIPLPYDILEPVNRTQASAAKKAYDEFKAAKTADREERRARRIALGKLAAETE